MVTAQVQFTFNFNLKSFLYLKRITMTEYKLGAVDHSSVY